MLWKMVLSLVDPETQERTTLTQKEKIIPNGSGTLHSSGAWTVALQFSLSSLPCIYSVSGPSGHFPKVSTAKFTGHRGKRITILSWRKGQLLGTGCE